MGNELSARCNGIEDCYEFMLAYAGQGLSGDDAGQSSSQLRHYLNHAVEALSGLAEVYSSAVKQVNLQPVESHQAFLDVLDRDAGDSLAAIRLVLGQPSLSSQLIDNLPGLVFRPASNPADTAQSTTAIRMNTSPLLT